jgi:hypothetical protein
VKILILPFGEGEEGQKSKAESTIMEGFLPENSKK